MSFNVHVGNVQVGDALHSVNDDDIVIQAENES